jgi:virulence-associated protein VapD
MLKHVYKTIVLVAVFATSLFLMGKNIKEYKAETDKVIEMKEASFPIINMGIQGQTLNRLHGYSGNLDANIVREVITPIDKDKKILLDIIENKSVVKKIKYEIREVNENELLDSGLISALDTTETGKKVEIKIQAKLEIGKEYAMKITAITADSEKINYYTRIKHYEDDFFLKEKTDFVNNFHKSSMDKEKAKSLTKYLESDSTKENDSFAKVSIDSSLDLVSWGKLKPNVVTKITPTIQEFNIETASIQLDYFVSIDTQSGTHFYRVTEFYRVRYTMDRVFLLKFERTMEAAFDIGLTDVENREFNIGISSETNLDIRTSPDCNSICFEREGALWYYNLKENKAIRVFSFMEPDGNFDKNAYDQHDIKVLNLDDKGNIDFIVYGYMNRGDFEGSVGVILYRFNKEENRIEEQVYIPMNTTYQLLKENLNQFSYVNKKGVFYVAISNCIYSYNIAAKKLEVVADYVLDDSFLMLEEGKAIAWLDAKNPKEAKEINILDLESEQKKIIKAPAGNNIRIFGSIDANIIYGYVKGEDIIEGIDGTVVIPAYKLDIADCDGNVLKSYEKENIYIRDVLVEDNVVKLLRIKKTNTGKKYKDIAEDSILNKKEVNVTAAELTTKFTEEALTQLYVSLIGITTMEKKPEVDYADKIVVRENTAVYLENTAKDIEKYYVYANGGIIESYDNLTDAILLADVEMGVVLNNDVQLIWERGGTFKRNSITGIDTVMVSDGVNSKGACLSMLLKHNQISVSGKELSSSKESIYQELKKHFKAPVNLTGCTLEQILYFVSGGKPVIAMKSENQAVLITAYDELSVSMIDPSTGGTKKMPLKVAGAMFKEAGSVFISYSH